MSSQESMDEQDWKDLQAKTHKQLAAARQKVKELEALLELIAKEIDDGDE